MTGSKLLLSPSPWSRVRTGRFTTNPAKLMTPAWGAKTVGPPVPSARSTPRCPLSHGWGGGSNPRITASRITAGLGDRGQVHPLLDGRSGPSISRAVEGIPEGPTIMDRVRSRQTPHRCKCVGSALIRCVMDLASARWRCCSPRNSANVDKSCQSFGVCPMVLPVVHFEEQFAVPPGIPACLIQRCGGAAADYAYPALTQNDTCVIGPGLGFLRSGTLCPMRMPNGCQEPSPSGCG